MTDFTTEEDELLRKWYGKMPNQQLVDSYFPNLTVIKVHRRAKKLGLIVKRSPPFEPYEDDVLKIMKQYSCPESLIAKVLGRTRHSVSSRANRLGFKIDTLNDYDDSELLKVYEQSLELPNLTSGTITELEVEAQILRLGFDLFKPFMINHMTDYLVANESALVKLQVKPGMYSKEKKRFRCNLQTKDSKKNILQYDPRDVDFFIVKCYGIDAFYVIPREVANGKSINLYPHRKTRASPINSKGNFEVYRNAFHLIKELLEERAK